MGRGCDSPNTRSYLATITVIQLRPYIASDFNALNSYHLVPSQARFTATIDYCIHERQDLQDPNKMVVVIIEQQTPVGFFVLDKDTSNLTTNQQAVMIRSLSINPIYQGKGIGKRAMTAVPNFVRQHVTGINEIVLSVNMKNSAAYRVYQQAGYCDTGELIDGPEGAQHVMTQRIRDLKH